MLGYFLQETDIVLITNKDVSLKKHADASHLILKQSHLVISDVITISNAKEEDVCVEGNACNANAVMEAGESAGLIVKPVGSSIAYDMV